MKNNFKLNIPLAILITMIAVIYQRSTGPTYPRKWSPVFKQQSIKVRLPRSQGGEQNAPIEIPVIDEETTGTVTFKRFPSDDNWQVIDLKKEPGRLYAELPNQPPAGKLAYFVQLQNNSEFQSVGSATEPIIIRYKGTVPIMILGPHVFFMFLSMLLAVLGGLEALTNTKSFKVVTYLTTGSLLIGGMVLGPIVQKFAFDVYWAGFPYDWDLTDNKLLIGVVFWVGATLLNLKKQNRFVVIVAALVLLGVYSIPHSMMGSQLNYESGKIETDR